MDGGYVSLYLVTVHADWLHLCHLRTHVEKEDFHREVSPNFPDNVEHETFKLKCKLSIGLLIFDTGLNCVNLFGHLDVAMFCLLFGAMQLIFL
jgi:hypothetical protein